MSRKLVQSANYINKFIKLILIACASALICCRLFVLLPNALVSIQPIST